MRFEVQALPSLFLVILASLFLVIRPSLFFRHTPRKRSIQCANALSPSNQQSTNKNGAYAPLGSRLRESDGIEGMSFTPSPSSSSAQSHLFFPSSYSRHLFRHTPALFSRHTAIPFFSSYARLFFFVILRESGVSSARTRFPPVINNRPTKMALTRHWAPAFARATG